MKHTKHAPLPEWSFPVDADTIGDTPAVYNLSADEKACKNLAARFGVLALDSVKANLTLARERGGLVVHASGTVSANVTQRCVVTLEPVTTAIREEFDAYFSDPAEAIPFAPAKAEIKARQGEVETEMLDERDAPEPIENGQIDLGELAAQFLSLAVPTYPRAPGVRPPDEEADAVMQVESPFAALKDWKETLK